MNHQPTECEILIVGAGPAGLAVAGRLSKRQVPYMMIEKNNKVGFMWHCHYDRLCLHTVKQLSHLPHMPFPVDYPTYVSREQLVEYFDTYAKHFGITPRFGVEMKSLTPSGDKWQVITKGDEIYIARHVVIATGVNRVPNAPHWPGQEEFKGTIVHSREYKNPDPYNGQKVLVVGMGNTGAEIALDLAEHDIEVYLSVRGPVNIVPRDINGRPTQLTARILAKLPFGLGDWLGTAIRKIVIGDLQKYGLESSAVPPAVQLRETGKTPVIDLGTVALIKKRKIKVIGAIQSFYDDGVVLTNGTRMPFDEVVLATGYTPDIEQFFEDPEDLLDQHGAPKAPIGIGRFKGLYFIGFDNYKLGGILGTIFKDSEKVVDTILAS